MGRHQCNTVCACVWLLIGVFFWLFAKIFIKVSVISSVSLVLEIGEVQTQQSRCLNLLARLRAISSKRQLNSQELLCVGLFLLPPPVCCAISLDPGAWQSSSFTTVLQILWNPIYWFFLAFLKSSFSFPTVTVRLIEPMGWQYLTTALAVFSFHLMCYCFDISHSPEILSSTE